MADFTVRYADWKGGDFGVTDPGKADNDTFAGDNVYAYESGLLGVRAGVKRINVTGLPNHTVVPGPYAFWARPNTSDLLVLLGSQPWTFPAAGGAASSWVGLPATPVRPVKFLVGGGVTYALSNGVLYKYTSASVIAPVTTPAPLSYVTRWGYYFVGVDLNTPWRIWFSTVDSAGAQFGTWGANDYLDIGDSEAITALAPIFNTLYVGKPSGWYAVSGVLGTLASVRGVTMGGGPINPRLTSVTTDNRIIYWPLGKSPAFFNGERTSVVDEMDIDIVRQAPTADTVIVTPTSRRLIVAASDNVTTSLMSYRESAWTRHHFQYPVGGFAPSDVRDGASLPDDVIFAVLSPKIVGEPVNVLAFHHNLGRPGHHLDTYSSPTDDIPATKDLVTGTVSFPTYWEPIGRQVRVRAVIVQFRKWASGLSSTSNEMFVQIDSLGAYQSGDREGITHRWVEPCERSSRDGTDDSWRVGVGEQGYGNGFRISFPRLRGVALREVIVLADVRTDRT